MVDNAVRCGSLVGMTSDQVESIFGGDAEANRRGWADLDLGFTPTAFGGEYHYLKLRFDRRTSLVDHASRYDVTD